MVVYGIDCELVFSGLYNECDKVICDLLELIYIEIFDGNNGEK